ncbi:MAG: hypothetical protein KIH09_16425, partial [Candidatus Freyarchaeota archaeon]|nr:hypothetical protein [Candidatus Jordarchaeia archaeon]
LSKIGIITVKEYTTDYLVKTMVQLLGECPNNFSYIFRLNEAEFVKYEGGREVLPPLSFKELVDLTSMVKPIELSLLTDEHGLWLPIKNGGTPDKPLEFLPLVITRIKPENMIIIDIETENLFKYKLDDEETLDYYEHIINELNEIEIHFCARKWCNYLEYKNKVKKIIVKKPKIELSHLSKLIRFAETWLTTNICTESPAQNKTFKDELPLISDKTCNSAKEINEELIALKEKNILKSIIDTQQLIENLKKLNNRYDVILKINDKVKELVKDGEILDGNLTKKVEEGQYIKDDHLGKSFFAWSCYCTAQGLNLLIHGCTRVGLGKYAEGLQFISNGVDHIKYGLFFCLACNLGNLKEAFNQTEIKMYPEHISFRGLNLSRLLTCLNNSQNSAFDEKLSELKKTLSVIDEKIKSARNKSVYSHGLAPVMLTTGEIMSIKDTIQNLIRNYDFFIRHSLETLEAKWEDSLQNRTDDEKEKFRKEYIFPTQELYGMLEELRLSEVELEINKEINVVELLKKFLCYSCIEKAYNQLEMGAQNPYVNDKNRNSKNTGL